MRWNQISNFVLGSFVKVHYYVRMYEDYKTKLCFCFQAAVFMRNPDSLESLPPRVRATRTTTKAAAAPTASWATAGEAMDREGRAKARAPQTPGAPPPTNDQLGSVGTGVIGILHHFMDPQSSLSSAPLG